MAHSVRRIALISCDFVPKKKSPGETHTDREPRVAEERGFPVVIHPRYMALIKQLVCAKMGVTVPDERDLLGHKGLPPGVAVRPLAERSHIKKSTLERIFAREPKPSARPTSDGVRELCDWIGVPFPQISIAEPSEAYLVDGYRHLPALSDKARAAFGQAALKLVGLGQAVRASEDAADEIDRETGKLPE